MNDLFSNLALGFSTALTLPNLGLCLIGCMVGTLIGVLPGIGPIATITMLLPITFNFDPVGALIMLAGIYYGAQYGGSTTAILVNIPGEVTAIVTTLDGHQMARQGRAGVALGIAAIGSFFAGCVSTLVIAALARPLVKLALLSAVGTDLETGVERLTFGIPALTSGIDFAVLAMGVIGFSEVLKNLEAPEQRSATKQPIGRLLPGREDLERSAGPILRGTLLGTVLGILPGNGAVLAPYASYTLEKKLAKDPRRFGKGAIEGVAGPESANNAGAQSSFIPLLTLGIPPNAVMALMVGAMTIHGIVPGPLVMTKNATLFWGMIASMWVGNLMLLIINLPLVGIWVKLLDVPYRLMYPAILVFSCIGIYSVNNSASDVMLTGVFALVGYALLKLGFETAPLLLGYVLGRLMEENLRRALLIARGHFTTFVERPVSAGLLGGALIVLAAAILPAVRKRRAEVFTE